MREQRVHSSRCWSGSTGETSEPHHNQPIEAGQRKFGVRTRETACAVSFFQPSANEEQREGVRGRGGVCGGEMRSDL
jgi:hypothetical protein